MDGAVAGMGVDPFAIGGVGEPVAVPANKNAGFSEKGYRSPIPTKKKLDSI